MKLSELTEQAGSGDGFEKGGNFKVDLDMSADEINDLAAEDQSVPGQDIALAHILGVGNVNKLMIIGSEVEDGDPAAFDEAYKSFKQESTKDDREYGYTQIELGTYKGKKAAVVNDGLSVMAYVR